MRYSLLIVAALVLVGGSATAGDYIRIGVDSIMAGSTNFEIPFYIERTCPVPTYIMGISNGFVLTATGNASWSDADYSSIEINPIASAWFNLGGLWPYFDWDGTSPDFFLVAPDGPAGRRPGGMPVFEEMHFFSLFLDIGPGEGEILIDSAFFGVAGAWKWSGMTCGLGGAPNRPLFVDKYGSDANHPIHITVYEQPCGDANRDGFIDIDDPVFLLNYIFLYGPAPNPYLKSDCDCSGGDVPVDIDDVVHLLNYILRDGPEPCDVDGDGVPDC
jgi:hypothetical protein